MNAQPESPTTLRRLKHFTGRFDSGRDGRPVSVASIKRWITKGISVPNGELIRLRAEQHPYGLVTCDLWITEFASALTGARVSVR